MSTPASSATTSAPSTGKKVPFVDLQRQYAPIRAAMLKECEGVLNRCDFIQGKSVGEFEKEMAAWMGVQEVIGCSNATSGLFATLKMLGIGPGDEVITTPHTAIATAEAVTLTGARVVFADIDPVYYNLDPKEVEKKITSKTKAIIPVHLYGNPVDLDAMLAIAAKHGLKLIEDCAQAQGAKYKGKYVGTYGDAADFSFFPSKNLGGFGDGGAVVAKDPALSKKIRMFCNHGRQEKYTHEFEGMNSRLDTIQAAMLRHALPKLDEWNAQRRQAAAWYEALSDVKQVQLPKITPGGEHIYHVYVIQVDDREALAKYLKERNIATGVHYPMSLSVQPAFNYLNVAGKMPVAERACQRVLSLPMFPGITKEEVDTVVAAIREYFKA
jgi:dTDP-4-amino-4,6-dideoxygalactose transaminase